jgi:hypothetical protein
MSRRMNEWPEWPSARDWIKPPLYHGGCDAARAWWPTCNFQENTPHRCGCGQVSTSGAIRHRAPIARTPRKMHPIHRRPESHDRPSPNSVHSGDCRNAGAYLSNTDRDASGYPSARGRVAAYLARPFLSDSSRNLWSCRYVDWAKSRSLTYRMSIHIATEHARDGCRRGIVHSSARRSFRSDRAPLSCRVYTRKIRFGEVV